MCAVTWPLLPFRYCYVILHHFHYDFFCLCVNIRAGVEAAAWLSPPGCVGFDSAGPPGAAGEWGGHAERPAGRCWTPEQQSGTHCEFTNSITSSAGDWIHCFPQMSENLNAQRTPSGTVEGDSQPSKSFLVGETKIRRLKTLSQARWNTDGHFMDQTPSVRERKSAHH